MGSNTCSDCAQLIINDEQSYICSICDCLFHYKCKKNSNNRRSSKDQPSICNCCLNISPAHILQMFHQKFNILDDINKRIISLEESSDYMANEVKSISNKYNIIEGINEDINTFGNKIDNFIEKYEKIPSILSDEMLISNKILQSIRSLQSTLNDFELPQSTITTNVLQNNDSSFKSCLNDLKIDIKNCGKSIQKNNADLMKISENIDDIKKSQLTSTDLNHFRPTPIITNPSTHIPSHSSIQPVMGWRTLGSKRIWKKDWSYFDEKAQRRITCDKHRTKQLNIKKKRKNMDKSLTNLPKNIDDFSILDSISIRDNNTSIESANMQENKDNANISSTSFNRSHPFRQTLKKSGFLTPSATTSFSHPKNIDLTETTVKSTNANYSNFQKGETLNLSESTWINPIITPAVKLTQISALENGKYILSRLNDHRIYNIIRNYLAYLHDKPPSVVFEGMTCISSKVRIGAEGIPTDQTALLKLLVEYNERFGFTKHDTQADLNAVRSHYESNRISNLQKNRENFNKFHNINIKNKNF